jgi:hypothetical protein
LSTKQEEAARCILSFLTQNETVPSSHFPRTVYSANMMFIFGRATDTPMTPDSYIGDDVIAQEAEYEKLAPSGKQVATVVGASIAALVGLLLGIYVFNQVQRWYRMRLWRRRNSIRTVRRDEPSSGESPSQTPSDDSLDIEKASVLKVIS